MRVGNVAAALALEGQDPLARSGGAVKNPWMSMWLSAANSWTGAARGSMAAEMRKSQNAAIEEMTRQTMAFWSGGALAKPAPAKRRARKR